MGEQRHITGCSQLGTPRRWECGALGSARVWGHWPHGRGSPRTPHSPLSPSPAPHQLPRVPQEPPAPQTPWEPSFWGRAPRLNPTIPYGHPCHARLPPPRPPVPMPQPHATLSPGTHRYWKGATVAVTGWLCRGAEEKVMAPDPNTGPLPCEPPWGSFPIPAMAAPLTFPGDPPGRPAPLPCARGALGSSVGSPTLPAPLLPLPAASGYFPGDTRSLAGAFCPLRGGMPGMPSLPSDGSWPVALPAPLGLRVLGPGAGAFPGRGDGAPWGMGDPRVLVGAAACSLPWATARGTGMAEA